MHRWITRLFMLTTLGPILFWVGCFVAVTVFTSVYGCEVNEGGTYPCDVHGVEMGETAAMLFVLGAWGPLIFGPFVVASGAAWGVYALIRAVRRRRR